MEGVEGRQVWGRARVNGRRLGVTSGREERQHCVGHLPPPRGACPDYDSEVGTRPPWLDTRAFDIKEPP